MSKIDRNQSCISQLRRLFKVKRSNNIIENGPLWIGYRELFLKLMCRCFLFFMASENEKNKRGKLFPLLHTVHFAHLWVHTHCVFILEYTFHIKKAESLRTEHVKILKRYSHSAGLVDFFISL